jgi:hypothetical protein
MDLDPIFFGGFQNLEFFYSFLLHSLLISYRRYMYIILLKKKGLSEFCTGSLSVIQWYVSADPFQDPDPFKNVTDPEHCL